MAIKHAFGCSGGSSWEEFRFPTAQPLDWRALIRRLTARVTTCLITLSYYSALLSELSAAVRSAADSDYRKSAYCNSYFRNSDYRNSDYRNLRRSQFEAVSSRARPRIVKQSIWRAQLERLVHDVFELHSSATRSCAQRGPLKRISQVI